MLPKIGDMVNCPADRGDAAYRGKVTHVSGAMQKSHQGVLYAWVSVEHPSRTSRHVRPSNRLGFKLEPGELPENSSTEQTGESK